MASVHELLDKIISYLALAFQHGQDTGPENLLKLLYLAPGKHIKGPAPSEKAISDYGMKMRMKPGVISKGMNDHHKAWNSVRKAKHSMKEDLKTFPCTMAEVCQKPPVVLEIDPEKNGYAEYKLPVGYRIEDIVACILSELDHLFGMAAWTEPPTFAAKCQEIFMVAIWIRAPDPGKSFCQVSALQVIMYYLINNWTKEAILFLVALLLCSMFYSGDWVGSLG